jgi:CHASE3 domain sensor protein
MPVHSAKRVFANYLVYTVVCVIGILLLINAFLLYENSRVIERNRAIQAEAERIKVNTLDIVRNLHQADMGLRGYYLLKDSNQKDATIESSRNIRIVFSDLEKALSSQGFSMQRFNIVRDSILIYYGIVDDMQEMVESGDDEKFMTRLRENHGFYAWQTYFNFSKEISAFEDHVAAKARSNYELALRNSYLLQIVLFLITVPAMVYMAYYTLSAFKVSEQLRFSEAEKGKILAEQNEDLERMVQLRTNEILAQNEEITSHNEQLRLQRNEIESQNHQLLEAK